MADRKIEVVISATDDYSAAMRKFNNAVGDMDGAVAKAGQASNKLSRQLDGLTSGLDWAAGGVKKFKNMLEGMAFGGVIGLVAGGVSAFTEMLMDAYKASSMTADKLSSLNGELVQQATSWKMIVPAVGGATEAVIEYYNARLDLAKFEGTQRKTELEAEIEKQKKLKENYEINAKAFPQRTELARKAKEYAVSLKGLNLELASINTVAALTPMALNKVQAALAATAKSVKTVATATHEDFTGGAFSEGVFSSLFLGALDMPKEELALTRVFGEVLSNAVASAAESAKLAMPKFDLFAGLVTDSGGKGGGTPVIEQMEADLKRMEQMGSPKTLWQVGAPQEFSESVQLNSRLQEIQKYYEDRTDLMRALGRSEVEINEVKNQQILAQEQQLSHLKMALVQGSFAMMSNTMQNLTVLIGKEGGAAFKAMKAFAIAETTIQTYRAAMGSYAALAPIPVVGPALAIAAATAATIAGMARVKQIAAMEPGGTASGTTIGPGGSANPSYSGGSPNAYPVPTRTEEKQRPQIIFQIEKIELLDESSVDLLMSRISERAEKYDVRLVASSTVN